MLIIAIDDEPKMLRLLKAAIREAAPGDEIRDFSSGTEALSAIEEERLVPSFVFTDIQMPRMSGLKLAVELKRLVPDTRIVFVTGFDEYAVDAYRMHINGYIIKPVDADRIREELAAAPEYLPEGKDKLVVRCFGYFEVFWRGEPLVFSRHKTKELLAWLIDRKGASCGAEEAIAVLYEKTEPEDMKRAKQNLRNLVSDLKYTLKSIGKDEVLIRKGRTLAIRYGELDCDLYRMLEGDMTAVNSYRGEYMEQYSWAEITKGNLQFEYLLQEYET